MNSKRHALTLLAYITAGLIVFVGFIRFVIIPIEEGKKAKRQARAEAEVVRQIEKTQPRIYGDIAIFDISGQNEAMTKYSDHIEAKLEAWRKENEFNGSYMTFSSPLPGNLSRTFIMHKK